MRVAVLLVLLCSTVSLADEAFEESTTKIAIGVYGDCSKSEDFYVCLKKKAVTFLDRLGRAEKFSIGDSVQIVRDPAVPVEGDVVTEAKLDEILPRSTDARNAALSQMLTSKVSDLIQSKTIEISLPRTFSDEDDEEDDDSIDEGEQLPLI